MCFGIFIQKKLKTSLQNNLRTKSTLMLLLADSIIYKTIMFTDTTHSILLRIICICACKETKTEKKGKTGCFLELFPLGKIKCCCYGDPDVFIARRYRFSVYEDVVFSYQLIKNILRPCHFVNVCLIVTRI